MLVRVARRRTQAVDFVEDDRLVALPEVGSEPADALVVDDGDVVGLRERLQASAHGAEERDHDPVRVPESTEVSHPLRDQALRRYDEGEVGRAELA